MPAALDTPLRMLEGPQADGTIAGTDAYGDLVEVRGAVIPNDVRDTVAVKIPDRDVARRPYGEVDFKPGP